MSKNIILIDKRVQYYETILAAIDPALAVGVVFDYYDDTFEIVKTRMRELEGVSPSLGNPISVGLIQHNYKAPIFTMLASADVAPVAQAATQDPDITEWAQVRDFILWCKTELNAAYFDMMACALYSDPNWKYVIDTLTMQTGVTVRASTDDTGATVMGGDWFLESNTGVNMKTVYFTEAIEEYKGLLYSIPYEIREYLTKGIATGNIQTWSGDSAPSSVTDASSGVVEVYLKTYASAALKNDGSVVAWGHIGAGGTAPSSVTNANSGVVAVYSTEGNFAALKNDGSIVAWGDVRYVAPSSVTDANSGVVAVCSNRVSFAALKNNGSVVAWGWTGGGGTTPENVSSGVVAVYSTEYAFAALKTDGSLVVWGHADYGGTTAPSSVTNANSGVVAVYSTTNTFAALKNDGSVVMWGSWWTAPSSVTDSNSGVIAVYSTYYAYTALKNNGSVVTWGNSSSYDAPSSVTAANSGVVAVYCTWLAFAALKTDGSVVAWGYSGYGGSAPSSVTAANSGVVAIYSNQYAFAALKNDGSVIVWGASGQGGDGAPSSVTDANSGVVAVYSNSSAFAALKNDGSIVTWGNSSYGGTGAPSSVTDANSGVVTVYSSGYEDGRVFAALKTSATTFDLSMSYYTNADRYNILRKRENRRRVNLTTLNNNVFTLSSSADRQVINPSIPTNKTLKIIVPTYVASSYSITSTATIPNSSGSFIVACDESEHVTISGIIYVNYGTYIYKRETNNTYTKATSDTINGRAYELYGGDGINTSGIVFLESSLQVSTLSASTFTVASSKTFGDASFAITTRPTSNNNSVPIVYSSSNTNVATVDASGNFITLVGAGDVYFNATQATTSQYASSTKTSNTLTVARATSTLSGSSFSIASSKTVGDASFAITTRPTSNNTSVPIVYSSSNTNVATVDASGNFITLVGAGDVSLNASQIQTSQYNAATKTSNTLTVARGTSTLSSSTFQVASSKTILDASFAITIRPTTNNNSVDIVYSSSNTSVATIDASGNWITIIGLGDVSFNATQVQTNQYNAATKTSNTLTVSRATSTLSGSLFSVAVSKTFGDASFSFDVLPTSNNTSVPIVYSSSNTDVATVDASGNFITLVGAGDVSFIAAQAQTAQYNAATKTSNTLSVARATSTFLDSSFSVASSKTFGDESFSFDILPTSNSDGLIIYSSSNTDVATVDGTTITLAGAGNVSFNASQLQTNQYFSATKTSNTLSVSRGTSTFSGSSFSVAASKMFGDASFSFDVLPTSNSDGVITYSSSNPNVATVDASGTTITLVGAGDVSFNASQAQTNQYNAATKTSNTLSVSRGTPTLSGSSFSVASSKTFGDASFAIITRPTSNNASVPIVYSSSNTNVATIDASGNFITLVGAGDVSFNASQAQTKQYNAVTKTSNTLSVSRATSTFLDSSFSVASSKTFGDASFSFNVLPTSNSDGLITYSSSNTNVATVDASGTTITLVGAGDVSFNAAQEQTNQYNAATKTSNTLSVERATSTLLDSSFSVAASKTFGDASFSFDVLPTSNSDGLITYSSSNPNVATVDASGTTITLVGAGDVSFNAAQEQTNQYFSATKTSNTLSVSRGTSTLSGSSFSVAPSKTFGDASFSFNVLPTSNNTSVPIVYSSSNTNVATVDASGTMITIVGAGEVSFTATQAQTNQYNAATKISNTLTVSTGTIILAFVSPPTTKNVTDSPFTVVATSISSGAITYSSSNTAVASVNVSTGLVTLNSAGTVTITASQEATTKYSAANSTCSIVVTSAGTWYSNNTIRDYSSKSVSTGSIISWGLSSYGGTIPDNVSSDVVTVSSSEGAFAALKTDGSVVAWGNSASGASAPSNVTSANSGVVAIYSTGSAFAALKTDGSIVAWGRASYGGTDPGINSGVVAVYSTYYAFAALKSDGSVVAWGNSSYGGVAPSSVTAANSGVVAIYSTDSAFAALKTNGSVVVWGDSSKGGTDPGINSGVVAVYSTYFAFAALKTDGNVVAWGNSSYGGSAPSSVTSANSGVISLYSNQGAFVALKTNGSVVAWGNSSYGGTGAAPTSVTVTNSNVIAVYATYSAFAALKTNGSVVVWGSAGNGGTAPSSVTAANSGVIELYATNEAFAALKNNGSVVAWGVPSSGATAPSSVTTANSGVVAIYSTGNAFAALKNDGSVVVWGDSTYGGTDPSISSGVVAVYSNFYAFAAVKTTATTFDLSFSYYSDIDRYNILRKRENRRRVNLTTLNNNAFTLSSSKDLQIVNPNIPAGKTLKIIVPIYVSSSYSITSNATIPAISGNFIVACDRGEPVTISGTTYVNYGAYVYKVEVNNTYTKTTSVIINGTPYMLYGGDGINSSGIIFLEVVQISTFASSTFTVASSKTFGDASFAITTRPTSNSDGLITYTSSNTNVATVDASGNFITLVGAGDVSFIANQAVTLDYVSATKTSNTLSVARATSTLLDSSFSVAASKTFGDASFSFNVLPTSNSDGLITYSSSNTNVAMVDASGTTITIIGAGSVTFNAAQAQTNQYNAATKTSNTLTVARATSTLSGSSFSVASSKSFGDASFAITTRPTSNNVSVPIVYSSSNTNVATIDSSGNFITLVGLGNVLFTATQAQTNQYNAATKTSNTLTVSIGIPTFGQFTLGPKSGIYNLVDESFLLTAPTSNSLGSFSYTSDNTAVASIQTLTNSHTTTNLIAKYDATVASSYTLSNGNITEWRDLTGNGYHLIPNGTGPTVGTINGINALNFDGDRGLSSSFVPLASAITIFMVIKYSANIRRYGSFIHHGNRDTDWSIEKDGYNNRLVFESGNNNNVAFDVTDSGNYILIGRIVGTTRQFWRYSNTESTQFSSGTPIQLVPGNKQIYVGRSDFGGAVESCNSHIGEILYYNASISNADVSSNLLYLQQKWFQDGLTVIGNSVTFISHGYANITATQDACGNFLSGSVTSPLVVYANNTSTLSGSSFSVAASKTFGDASFAITTRPTSNNTSVPIVYSSSNTNVATIDASGNFITLIGAGDVSFNASQAQTTQYNAATKTSNTLTVARATSTLSGTSFSVASSKTFGDAAFSFDTLPTSNNASVPIVYSSSDTNVATIDASGNFITLVGAGDVSFTATQAQTNQYNSATKTSNTLTVARATSTLSSSTFEVASSKTILDASFSFNTLPTSNNTSVPVVYSSSNPNVAMVDASGTTITIVGLGDVSFNAAQEQTAQYNAATKTSNTLTVSKVTTTLTFVTTPPTSKNVTDAPFTVVASSASSGAVTYSSSNSAIATVHASTGLVRLKTAGTVTITASQVSTANYSAPENATYSVVISPAGTAIQGQTVSSTASYESVDLSGASLAGTTVAGVSFSNANLSNVNFSGAVITNANFTNANISGATNLPAFSTVQKLQLLKNINNAGISAVQVSTPVPGSVINTLLATPRSEIEAATFTIKAPTTVDASANKIITISAADVSGKKSFYIPVNANETVKINNTVYLFDGTNLLNSTGGNVSYLSIEGNPFKIYTGSIVGLNVQDALNKITMNDDGLYDILLQILIARTI